MKKVSSLNEEIRANKTRLHKVSLHSFVHVFHTCFPVKSRQTRPRSLFDWVVTKVPIWSARELRLEKTAKQQLNACDDAVIMLVSLPSRLSITIPALIGWFDPVPWGDVSSSHNNKVQSAHRYMKIKNLPALDLLENRLEAIEWMHAQPRALHKWRALQAYRKVRINLDADSMCTYNFSWGTRDNHKLSCSLIQGFDSHFRLPSLINHLITKPL
jgi:hypothetical protein